MGNIYDFSLLVEFKLEFEYMMHCSTFDSDVQEKISRKFKKFKSKNVFKKHTQEIVAVFHKNCNLLQNWISPRLHAFN